ncbi:hypothetical protein MM440_12275 [Arsenicicoccus piscis]|uniref:Uncharacterized protein n=1 Tax=Arsenicicoccus piscis TaxID=673954 RepID=A0ABQ6HN64_9MICO|nr:hypothetical protein [Arsenicicoccus piscis]MCH8628521.1 hypothetical protein [Arsenicicoccus piscis]GMA19901.1 hypothetical protein GCM10025862_19220 [Arsenicicoccus piscis]
MTYPTITPADLPGCPIDLTAMDENATHAWHHAWTLGYLFGHAAGYGAGWQASDDSAERLHRAAFEAVQAAARQPAHDELARRRSRFGGAA